MLFFIPFRRIGSERPQSPTDFSSKSIGLGGGRVAPAWGAEVVSSNIVGYNKVNLSKGYNAIGVQFVNVGGDPKTLLDVVRLDDTYDGYTSAYKFPNQMQIWNGNGYDFYGWAGTSGTDVDDDASLDYTWTDLDAEAVDDVELPAFSGLWLNVASAGTATLSGEVVVTNVTVQLSAGYNMICNPFPAAVPVTSFGKLDASFDGYTAAYKFPTQMQVWNGNGYDFYGWAGTSGTDVDDDASLDYTWTDLDAEAVDAVIPIGGSVWINADHAGTITFSSPLAE